MKTMKFNVFLLAMVCASAVFSGYDFSLHNKSSESIYISLVNNDMFITENNALKPNILKTNYEKSKSTTIFTISSDNEYVPILSVRKNEFINLNLDLTKTTILTIYDNEQSEVKKFRFSLDKTIYINWNKRHSPPLYPQRGPKKGRTQMTDIGFSLDNNVSQKDIFGF